MGAGAVGSTLSGVTFTSVGPGYFAAGNLGAAFTSGISCYDSADYITMTIKNDTASKSGATPIFEAFMWGFKKPLE
jgi:hypothetical protein